MDTKFKPTRDDFNRYRENYQNEQDGITLYRYLATAEKDKNRAAIFERLARVEERHALRWVDLLKSGGQAEPDYHPGRRIRLLGWLARVLGTDKILPVIRILEARNTVDYQGQPEAGRLPAEERTHSRTIQAMELRIAGRESIVGRERWHRGGYSGSLRAAVFGVNDGLVSNFSLIMGVAGADVGSGYILLTGVAGLLAGAFSMGAGEYVSVRAQRELFEQQIAMEKQELEMSPEEEEEELSLIYQAKGIPEKEASNLAQRIIQNPKTAIDTLAREELGLNPTELGSPWGAAISSIFSFILGAVIPVLPFIILSGVPAISTSAFLSCLSLFGVGALISVFTTRGPVSSGLRMLSIGLLASAVTFAVGWMVGFSVR